MCLSVILNHAIQNVKVVHNLGGKEVENLRDVSKITVVSLS